VVQHDAGLDRRVALRRRLEHVAHVLGEVDHQAGADGLAALAGAAAARHDRHLQVAADVERQPHVLAARGTNTPTGSTW
jgi:hypothetical protein